MSGRRSPAVRTVVPSGRRRGRPGRSHARRMRPARPGSAAAWTGQAVRYPIGRIGGGANRFARQDDQSLDQRSAIDGDARQALADLNGMTSTARRSGPAAPAPGPSAGAAGRPAGGRARRGSRRRCPGDRRPGRNGGFRRPPGSPPPRSSPRACWPADARPDSPPPRRCRNQVAAEGDQAATTMRGPTSPDDSGAWRAQPPTVGDPRDMEGWRNLPGAWALMTIAAVEVAVRASWGWGHAGASTCRGQPGLVHGSVSGRTLRCCPLPPHPVRRTSRCSRPVVLVPTPSPGVSPAAVRPVRGSSARHLAAAPLSSWSTHQPPSDELRRP